MYMYVYMHLLTFWSVIIQYASAVYNSDGTGHLAYLNVHVEILICLFN